MAIAKYEVLGDDSTHDELVRVWGPGKSLDRAREVAKKSVAEFGESIRIDRLLYVDPRFPIYEAWEFFDPE